AYVSNQFRRPPRVLAQYDVYLVRVFLFFFFSSRRRHTRWPRDWSSDVCSSDLLQLTLSQSDRTVVAGSRVTLTAEIKLPPDVHVYSPGVRGYKPIQLILQAPGGIEPAPVIYPTPKTLYLEAIKEQVPVFDGSFRITQD